MKHGRKLTLWLLTLAMILTLAPLAATGASAAWRGAGGGSAENPDQIGTAANFTSDNAAHDVTVPAPGTEAALTAICALSVTAPTFDAVSVGYTQLEAKAITIASTGSSAATISGAALSGTGADAFTLNRTDGATIAAGATDDTTYTIQPKAGLDAGEYAATVTVTYNGGATAAADVRFTVCVPVYGVKGDVQDGSLVALAVSAPEGALLIAAVYDASGRQEGARTAPVKDIESFPYDTGLTVSGGQTCKLMLVNAPTCAPLCAAWSVGGDIPSSGFGKYVVEYAKQFIGNPYKWGGTSLTEGADAPGFVYRVYKNFGVDYGRLSSDGFLGVGQEVSFNLMEPGDVVVYSGHVAIYDGAGGSVEAQSSLAGITNNR